MNRNPHIGRNLPRPQNEGTAIQVVVTTVPDNPNAFPVLVTVTPVVQAGARYDDLQSLTVLADTLRLATRRRIDTYMNWPAARSNARAVGVLIMENWNNDGHRNARNNIALREITAGLFLEMFEEAQANGSNPDLRIADVDWKFAVNRASIEEGGSTNFNPGKLKGLRGWNFKIENAEVGCAAVCLVRGMIKHMRNTEGYHQRDFIAECIDMQINCAFEDPLNVTVSEFENFVELYPYYRVVIYSSSFGLPYIAQGELYENQSIYIYHDVSSRHYAYISSIKEFGKSFKNNNDTKFCSVCAWFYKSGQFCKCVENQKSQPKREAMVTCENCSLKYLKYTKHQCHHKKCKFCTGIFKDSESRDHRCPLYCAPDTKEFHTTTEVIRNAEFKHKYKLWFYDIESHFINTEETVKEYQVDNEGNFTVENGDFKFISKQRCDQLPNYLYAINGFTDERFETEDPNTFIDYFMSHNGGYNILVAHNGAGYDTRLLFSYLKDRCDDIQPILKGTKFMQLMVGKKLIFRDSLFHLTMSLASLAKAFNLQILKGYFPHVFSTLENLEYSGPIPDKKYFDMRYSRSQQEIDDFHSWHNEWSASSRVWNYREQRKLYCINDVEILKEVGMQYHYGILENLESVPHSQISPWFYPTMAGHMHKICLLHTSKDLDPSEATIEQLHEFTQSNAAMLEPIEHYFVKLAMRGGITNIFSYITEKDMHYQDIQSSYPSVQLDKNNFYPVGTPIIEVHDSNYYPCTFHAKDPLFEETGVHRCRDTLERKKEVMQRSSNRSTIIEVTPTNLHDYIANFFGFLVVDIIPNSERYHQTIQVHNGSRIMPTCRKTFKYPVFSEMLKYEISKGAIVTKIYRADRYKSKSSPWNGGPLSILYKCKMQHSKVINPDDYTRITERMSTFGVDCSTIATWSKNKVRKQIAKGIITAAWGKHAESVDHPATEVLLNSSVKSWNFYDSLLHNKHEISNISVVGSYTKFDYKNNNYLRPRLDKGYLPWAVAVTSYGRMKLDGEMQKIDPPGHSPRMTMCDTDSVIYSFDQNQYTTPEGDCLGDWETEDFESEHQGIKSFVSCGPKSYIMTAGDGTIVKKLKGVSLSLGHSNYYTHDIVKSNVMHNSNPANFFSNKKIRLPQRNFKSLNTNLTTDGRTKSGVGGAMTIYESLKEVSFHISDIKGEFREDGQPYRVYPFGYTGML